MQRLQDYTYNFTFKCEVISIGIDNFGEEVNRSACATVDRLPEVDW